MRKIPKIIHQIWLQGEKSVPEKYQKYTIKWIEMHPDYEYKFWDTHSIEQLLKEDYPEYIEHWYEFTDHIHRSDYGRIFILHKYGGMYTDFDSFPLKPIDGLFEQIEFNYDTPMDINCIKNNKNINKYDIILASRDILDKRLNMTYLNNSTMFSIPNCNIWLDFVNTCLHLLKSNDSLIPYFGYMVQNKKNNILDRIMILPFTYINNPNINKQYDQYIIHEYTQFKTKKGS
jgi:hypothetical protein